MGPFRPVPNGIKKSSISDTRSPKKKRSNRDSPTPKPRKNGCVNPFMGSILDELKKPTFKLKTLAGRQVRELGRKQALQQKSQYQKELTWYQKSSINSDSIKTKSMPFTAGMAKGKAHQMDALGNQVGLMATGGPTMIITAILAFEGNPHDRQTIEPLLKQHPSIVGQAPKEWVVDRGGSGKRPMGHTKRSIPGKPRKSDTPYQKQKKRKKFRRRAAMEPRIGHLKTEHRL